MAKNDELKQIFLSEALKAQEQLNELLTRLEKDHTDQKAVDSIFRITHTLKANAEGMGYTGASEMSHAIEDVFSAIRDGKIKIDESLIELLFKATDKLADLTNAIKTDQKVRYIGLKTRLSVALREALSRKEKTQDQGSGLTQGQEPNPSQEESQPIVLDDEEEEENESGQEEETQVAGVAFSDLVQVPVQKLDSLLNLVGELIIERDRLVTQSQKVQSDLGMDYTRLMRISSELQYSVMNARLVTVSTLFQKFHRVVRDAAVAEGKKINLILQGSEIEIDRSVLQTISDSMIHLLRNAVGHGMESPSRRRELGKPEQGDLLVKAYNDKESVVIEVTDDGNGIDSNAIKSKVIEKGLLSASQADLLTDYELIDFIFKPGFSSAKEVTSLSGRGVGLDVVKKSIDSIGGKVNIITKKGKGTTFRLRLPSSMAVKSVLLFELGTTTYAIPLTFTESVITVTKKQINRLTTGLVGSYLDKTISVLFLSDLFDTQALGKDLYFTPTFKGYDQTPADKKLYMIIVVVDGQLIGFVVDDVLQQKDIIEKPLQRPLEGSRYFSGAAIMGNGSVSLVLDVPSILSSVFRTVLR